MFIYLAFIVIVILVKVSRKARDTQSNILVYTLTICCHDDPLIALPLDTIRLYLRLKKRDLKKCTMPGIASEARVATAPLAGAHSNAGRADHR